MSARLRLLLPLVAWTFAAAACGAGGTDAPVVGGQCREVLHAACARAVTGCQLMSSPWAATVDQCVTENLPSCCADACDRQAKSTEASVQACQRALQTADCAALAQGTLPAECQQVVY